MPAGRRGPEADAPNDWGTGQAAAAAEALFAGDAHPHAALHLGGLHFLALKFTENEAKYAIILNFIFQNKT